MTDDKIIDFHSLKNKKSKKSPPVPEQETAEITELFNRLSSLPVHMQEYIGGRFTFLMMYAMVSVHVTEVLKNEGYDPADFEPEEESTEAFLCNGPYLPEDEDQELVWNGPMFDSVRDGVTYRVATTVELDDENGFDLSLDLMKREEDGETWQIFMDGEWQPGPPDDYFYYLSMERDRMDDDGEDWDDEDYEPPEFIYDLDLPAATISALAREGIETVEDLCGKTRAELLSIKGIGRRSVEMIEVELECYDKGLKA